MASEDRELEKAQKQQPKKTPAEMKQEAAMALVNEMNKLLKERLKNYKEPTDAQKKQIAEDIINRRVRFKMKTKKPKPDPKKEKKAEKSMLAEFRDISKIAFTSMMAYGGYEAIVQQVPPKDLGITAQDGAQSFNAKGGAPGAQSKILEQLHGDGQNLRARTLQNLVVNTGFRLEADEQIETLSQRPENGLELIPKPTPEYKQVDHEEEFKAQQSNKIIEQAEEEDYQFKSPLSMEPPKPTPDKQ